MVREQEKEGWKCLGHPPKYDCLGNLWPNCDGLFKRNMYSVCWHNLSPTYSLKEYNKAYMSHRLGYLWGKNVLIYAIYLKLHQK